MRLKPIRTDDEYEAAIREVERLWEAQPGTQDHDRLEVVATLVDQYESSRWPIGEPDPVEAIRFFIAQAGRTQNDLADVLGSRSRASEILHRQRRLTLPMIRKLTRAWSIPAECLISEYDLRVKKAS